MPATLVLGGEGSGHRQYAAKLLADQGTVTIVTPTVDQHEEFSVPSPVAQHDGERRWNAVHTHDLTHTLLRSRHPVLVNDLIDWVSARLGSADEEQALSALTDAAHELATLCLGVPFDVVLISTEPGLASSKQDRRRLQQAIGRTNAIVGALLPRVVLVTAGRAVDIGGSPQAE